MLSAVLAIVNLSVWPSVWPSVTRWYHAKTTIGPWLLLITNRKSYMRFRLIPKSLTLDDLEWPWTAKTHSVAEKMRLLEPTAQIWMRIDPYYQRLKCRPMNLVSKNIRFMGIFVGVPLGGGVKWEWGWRRRQFSAIWVATSSESSELRPAVLYGDMLPLLGR